jgi:transposase-like protein
VGGHEEREVISVTKERTVCSPEFKSKVGLEALRGVKTINEIGREYGVHPVPVGQRKKESRSCCTARLAN